MFKKIKAMTMWMVDSEYLLTPIAHDVHNVPNRFGTNRHYLRFFGVRIASWVIFKQSAS